MARISTYDQDSTLNKLDKVLGTDSATGGTKNYTLESVVNLINGEDLIQVFDGVSYAFKSYEAGSTTPRGIINLNAGTASQAAFSAVNQIYISILDKGGNTIADYLDDTVNSFVRIVQKSDINVYGVFEVTAVANHDGGAYKLLTVTPRIENGNIIPNEEYFISNYSAVFDQDFSDDSVTEFGDVTSAGSGAIITTAERNNLTNLNTNALLHSDVVDNVTTTTTDVPLSANQGKVLKDLIDAINTLLTSDNVNLDSLQEVVDFIEANKSTLDNLSISNIAGLQAALDSKEDSVAGKGLSTEDFTSTLLAKLNSIATGAQVNVKSNWAQGNPSDGSFIENKPSDVTDLSTHGVTELQDITSAGSGAIITSTERNRVDPTHATFIGLSSAERSKLTGIDVNTSTRVVTDGTDSVTVPPADATATSTANVVAALTAGSNITISSGGVIAATDTDTNTTYDLTVHDSGDDAIIRLAGSDSTTDNVTLVAGNNVTLTPNSSNVTIDIDLTTAAVSDGSTSLVTGDHVFDYADPKFARKDQAETFSNNVTIQGDLTVSGTTTTVNTTELNIGDAIITLNSDLASVTAPSENAGIEINRGSSTDVKLIWDEGDDKWKFTNDGSTYYLLPSNLTDLGNVNVTSVADNQFLRYNSSTSKWENETVSFTSTIGGLTDVTISSVANGQVLKYNSSTSQWENQADAGGIALTDLSVGSPASASGSGAIAYNNSTGVFTYTPPDLSNNVTGTGQANLLAIWSGSNNLTSDSGVVWDGMSAYFGINNTSPSKTLDVTGDIRASASMLIGTDLVHEGDSNTKIAFTDDQITLTTGGIENIKFTPTEIVINETSDNTLDFRVESASASSLLFVDASANAVGINTSTPSRTNGITIQDSGLRINNSYGYMDFGQLYNHTDLRLATSTAKFYVSTGSSGPGGPSDTQLGTTLVGQLGVAETSPTVAIDAGNATDAIKIPNGTTAQRPSSPASGMFRYNTTDGKFEGYTTEWGEIGGAGGGASVISRDTFNGTGSQTTFVLSASVSDEINTQVYIDGVYQSKLTYSTSGTNLTFSTAPAAGTNNIEVINVSSVAVDGASTINKTEITGDGSTTNFTLNITPTSEDFTFVFIEGVYQEKSTYVISSDTISFSTAPQNGYSVEVMSINAVNIQQTSYLEHDSFTGNGSQTDFVLTNGSPTDEKFTMVFIQGVYQEKSTYSLSGSTIAFALAPSNGYTIEIISINGGGISSSATSAATTIADIKYNVQVISGNTTAAGHGYLYVFTASLTLTLPASPAAGDSIKISNRSGTTTCVLGANGNKIMGAAADLTLDTASASFELIYSGTNQGWIIIGQ